MTTKHELLIDGSERWDKILVLAHGAGAPMDTEFMNTVAVDLANKRICVVRFEFPYMRERRRTGKKKPPNTQNRLLETYREVIAQLGRPGRLIIGGKSMGGRIASMVADEQGVRGLLCLGYPFHPPGNRDKLRTGHLTGLRTPALIVQGERDGFGTRDEVGGFELSRNIRFAWMPDGDHSFKPRVRSGHTLQENLEVCIAAIVEFADGL